MTLTEKEKFLLEDMKAQEQLCIEKYTRYSGEACDGKLKNLFTEIGNQEKTHLETVNKMLGGSVSPTTSCGVSTCECASGCNGCEKERDAYLCQDALASEKHVSSVYDTCIFEFGDADARNTLNHIQKEEQEHGEKLYLYMSANGMSC